MSAQFQLDGSNTIVTFEYEALTAKIQDIVGGASEYLWDKGKGDHGTDETPIVFGDLTNQQKLNIVDEYVKDSIVSLANTYKSNEAQDAARELEAASEHTL